MQSNCSEDAKSIIVGQKLDNFFYSQTIHFFFKSSLGSTESLQPLGTSLSSAAKTVRFDDL